MGALDEITQMKNQGMSDSEINNSLQGRFSPKEIQDAMSQSQIKNAVSREEDFIPSPENSQPNYNPQIIEDEYSPSQPQMQEETYSPQPQQDYYSQEQQYTPQTQDYSAQDYSGGYTSGGGTDTMIEVAEQVYEQKMKKLQKQIDDFTEFKTLAETKLEMAMERLKRIEATMDKLQTAILDKVGSYGNTLQSIKKEMSMMQDSFGKVVNKAVHGHKK